MNIYLSIIGGFSLVLIYLAWREHTSANARDAKLLASVAVCAGIGGVAATLL